MKLVRILFLVVILLAGCTAVPTATVKGTGSSVYPAPQNSAVPTVPGPTREPGTATIQGRLLLKGKPVTQGIIYFSKVIQDNKGHDIVVGLDRTSLLNSDLTKNGQFTVYNIPPGKYGIVLDLVSHGALLEVPGKQESLLVTVEQGKDMNLGDLDYTDLPLP